MDGGLAAFDETAPTPVAPSILWDVLGSKDYYYDFVIRLRVEGKSYLA